MAQRANIVPMEKKGPLSETCLEAALSIISTDGLEMLSLREVARRLGVSHQAPYKHFASRDHLLAQIIKRCLGGFADSLRASGVDGFGQPKSTEDAMRSLGVAYLEYAMQKPLEYKLMFGTAWPDVAHEAGIDGDARAAFDVLRERLSALRPDSNQHHLDLDAMFVWSSMHGIASVLQSGAMRHLHFDEGKASEAVSHAMQMIDRVIFNQK